MSDRIAITKGRTPYIKAVLRQSTIETKIVTHAAIPTLPMSPIAVKLPILFPISFWSLLFAISAKLMG